MKFQTSFNAVEIIEMNPAESSPDWPYAHYPALNRSVVAFGGGYCHKEKQPNGIGVKPMELFLMIVTAVFLIASVGIAKWMQPLGIKLILLGILVAAAGCWFSLLEMETSNAAHASPVMMRLSVILVLAGVGCTFMPHFTREPDAEEPADHGHGVGEKDEAEEEESHGNG